MYSLSLKYMGNFMKNKHIFAVISIMLVPVIFSGCAATPVPVKEEPVKEVVKETPSPPDTFTPLTLSILRQLGESFESNDIGRYQMALAGKIIMEKDYPHKSIHYPYPGDRGKAEILTEHIREVIIINDQEKGRAKEYYNMGSRAIISVCFEEEAGIYKDYYNLSFSCRADEMNEYFYIDYCPYSPSEPPALSEDKGTLEYGGNSFRLKYTDVDPRPYLLIKLSQKEAPERLISRVVPGQVVK
jgi:hypothetical protein